MTSSWDWIGKYTDDALQQGDGQKLRLSMISVYAEQIPPADPAGKLEIYRQGVALARQLKEPWWEMFYLHWEIETLLHKQARPQEALAVAARANVELRKPIYDHFPQRCGLQLNLVSCYLYLDPIGYESQLRKAFAPLEKDCAQWSEFECYYAQQWGHFLNDVEDEGALDAAWEYLRLAQVSATAWDLKCALTLLCIVLWRVDEPLARQIGRELAADCETLAREEDQLDDIAMMQGWQAVAHRSHGEVEAAQKFYERAWQTQKRAPAPRNDVHGAAMKFHEIGGEWEAALQVCQREIRILQRHELRFLETKRRFKKCELLKQLERPAPMKREIARARVAASGLKSRDYWESKLQTLGQDETG